MITALTQAPVYCPDCRKPRRFVRLAERDIKSDTGKTIWEKWGCSVCGYTTIEPIKDNLTNGV